MGYPEEKAKERISKGNDRVERIRRLEQHPCFVLFFCNLIEKLGNNLALQK